MTSAETRLHEALHQAGSVAVGTLDFDQLSRRHRRQVRGRWAASCTLMAVIVASVIWTVSGGGSDSGKARLVPVASPTATDAPGITLGKSFSAEGGTFRYPSSWNLATYNEVTSFSFSIAYLGTGPLHDPCTRGEGNLSCGPKNLGRLGPSGILVSWDIYGFPGVGIDNEPGSPTTIDDSPARIQVKRAVAGTQCAVIGAVTEVDVAVATTSSHGPGGLWRMNACLADPGASDAVDTVIAVARSLRLTAPSPS
jgi:hypothetical protein